METATLTTPKVTLDVYPAASDLRSRLRTQSATPASLLPGGMILEESPEALVYRMAMPGAWRVEREGEDLCLTNAEGATVRVHDGKLSLTIAK
jgi:hypothetical protein